MRSWLPYRLLVQWIFYGSVVANYVHQQRHAGEVILRLKIALWNTVLVLIKTLFRSSYDQLFICVLHDGWIVCRVTPTLQCRLCWRTDSREQAAQSAVFWRKRKHRLLCSLPTHSNWKESIVVFWSCYLFISNKCRLRNSLSIVFVSHLTSKKLSVCTRWR